MLKPHTPPALHPPFAKYSHAMEVPPGARLLFASGQLGITKEKHIPEDAAGQAELCFQAIGEILASADMRYSDIIRINAFVTDRALPGDRYVTHHWGYYYYFQNRYETPKRLARKFRRARS